VSTFDPSSYLPSSSAFICVHLRFPAGIDYTIRVAVQTLDRQITLEGEIHCKTQMNTDDEDR
jgi:hypothetical protein